VRVEQEIKLFNGISRRAWQSPGKSYSPETPGGQPSERATECRHDHR